MLQYIDFGALALLLICAGVVAGGIALNYFCRKAEARLRRQSKRIAIETEDASLRAVRKGVEL